MALELAGNESIYALLGTILGGVGVKFLERWIARDAQKQDAETKLRDELWKEMANLRGELATVRTELDDWKERYFALYKEHSELMQRYILVTEERNLLKRRIGMEQHDRIVVLGEEEE